MFLKRKWRNHFTNTWSFSVISHLWRNCLELELVDVHRPWGNHYDLGEMKIIHKCEVEMDDY